MTQNKTEIVISAVDRATATIERISGRLDAAVAPAARLAGALGGMMRATGLGALGGTVSSAASSLVGLATAAAGTATAITGAAGGLFAFAKSAADAAGKVNDLTGRYQVGAETLQVYASMLEESGGSIEDAAVGMGKLKKAMNEAIHGGKEQAAAFAGIGISVEQLKRMSMDDVMAKMADAFKSAGDGKDLQKQAVLLALMGKNGTAFMETMNKGSAAYADRLREMREDGALLAAEHLAQEDSFAESWDRLVRTFNGVKTMLGLQVAEALQPLVVQLREWISANRELLAGKLDDFLRELPGLMKSAGEFFSAMWKAGVMLADAIRRVSDVLGPVVTAFGLIAVVFAPAVLAAGQMVFALGKVAWVVGHLTGLIPTAIAIIKTLWFVMAANPIGLIVAAVVGLAVVIYKNWDGIVSYVQNAWERIKSSFEVGFFDGLIQSWLESWQMLGNAILGIIKSVVPDSWMPKALADAQFTFASDRHSDLVMKQAAGEQRVKNEVSIKIDSEGRPSVKEMRSGSPNTTMDVSTGWSMVAP